MNQLWSSPLGLDMATHMAAPPHSFGRNLNFRVGK